MINDPIDAIEAMRKTNNKNWMDILRIAMKYAPEETREVLRSINRTDKVISEYLEKL